MCIIPPTAPRSSSVDTDHPSGATDYELVRVYHPDSPIARAHPPEISEARFHAISTSYDVLRGRRPTHDPDSPDAPLHPRVDLHALWRAKQRLRQDPLSGPADDRWKDGILLGSIIVVRSFHFGCHGWDFGEILLNEMRRHSVRLSTKWPHHVGSRWSTRSEVLSVRARSERDFGAHLNRATICDS